MQLLHLLAPLVAPLFLTASALPQAEPAANPLAQEPLCTTYAQVFIHFVVNMEGWGSNQKGPGEGLLDKMNTQAAIVNDWKCSPMGGNWTQAKFALPATTDTAISKNPWRIVNTAIKLASQGAVDPNTDWCTS